MADFNLKILSKRDENNNGRINTCYICEGNLEDYVNSVDNKYTDYDVQRGLVSNVYLDRLTETILGGKFIPPIVLIATNYSNDTSDTIKISEYKILDGLQRTYRIKSIYKALELYIEEIEKKVNFIEISKFKLSKRYKETLKDRDTNIDVFWSIIKQVEKHSYIIDDLKDSFSNFIQWFEIWIGLDKKEQINKMLVLNAGHKPMDIKHQLELLFLNIIPNTYLANFIRAKDVNSSFFYNKKELEQLHLSHFISALLSFDKAIPITVDAKFIQELQDNLDTELDKLKFYFEGNNLEVLIDFTKKLDTLFYNHYSSLGLQWLGRETILVGLFSAFGRYYQSKKNELTLEATLKEIVKKIEKDISIFKIEEFNKAKTTSIDITKVNIGNVFKYTTFNAMCKFLLKNNKTINWDETFKYGTKADNDCK